MKTLLLNTMLVIAMAVGAQNEWVTIQNGLLWKTETGDVVQAHAPGFLKVGERWYMCGEDRSVPFSPDVNLYSSTDLQHWRFENKIIKNRVTTEELGRSRMIERPKLLYNAKTGKYLVWCHYESSNYGASEAACFECDSVNGDYRFVWGGRPLGIKSRDCNVYQDTDGTAYFISTTEENQHLGLFRLSDDYREAVEHTQLFPRQSREAPAIVRLPEGRYFMFNSACSGWAPNQCKMAYTMNLKEGWTPLENIGNPIAYDTQAAAILEIKGTKATTYLYVGDRWQDPSLPATKTIIFPISFDGTECKFEYHERFDINFETGEWRETPTEGIFADNTKWKTLEQDDEHITIDMGKKQSIKGFIAKPREKAGERWLIRRYQLLTSKDGKTWDTASEGRWLPYWTEVDFESRECRYIKLVSPDARMRSVEEVVVVKG
jgi:sucrose-6-phosphate hydrolase SacC (GH32 family)